MMENSSEVKKNIVIYWCVNLFMPLYFLSTVFLNISVISGRHSFLTFHTIFYTSLLLIIVLSYLNTRTNMGGSKSLLTLFLIYMSYCMYYIFIAPQLNREFMQAVPLDNDTLIRLSLVLLMFVACIPLISHYFNPTIFSKIIVVIQTLYLFYFFGTSDLTPYITTAMGQYEKDGADWFSYGLVPPFELSHMGGIGFLCTLFLFYRQGGRKIIPIVGMCISLVIHGYAAIIAGKRGPLLMLILTIIIFYYFYTQLSKSLLFIILIGVYVVFLFSDILINKMIESGTYSGIATRFLNTASDNGSGRFGDDDAVYEVALRQIMKNPIFGSYFRITNKISQLCYGIYPHNFFLETIMTFGIVFSLPLYYIIYKAFKKIPVLIKSRGKHMLIALLACYIFLCYQTSETIFLAYRFWVLISMLVVVTRNSEE